MPSIWYRNVTESIVKFYLTNPLMPYSTVVGKKPVVQYCKLSSNNTSNSNEIMGKGICGRKRTKYTIWRKIGPITDIFLKHFFSQSTSVSSALEDLAMMCYINLCSTLHYITLKDAALDTIAWNQQSRESLSWTCWKQQKTREILHTIKTCCTKSNSNQIKLASDLNYHMEVFTALHVM